MSLDCAVCGSPEVTKTVDTENGSAALCDFHYNFVVDEATKRASAERAAWRLKAKES